MSYGVKPHLFKITALTMARLTAVTKKDGGVRGIATGCSLRCLTARTLAKQFAKDFESECAPFQFALSTRAGTDCVGHLLRAATDVNPNATVLSVDGVGAYDHILRAAMMSRLARMPNGTQHLQSTVGTTTKGDGGPVTQAEGGEQGDPLMPLLFLIGIQSALEEVSQSLLVGESIPGRFVFVVRAREGEALA